MIRQAITCDICASEKKQTNHWFVAYEQGGELRVSGWSSRNRQRPGAKHLCGQTCLHKLVDDFMARTLVKIPANGELAEQEMESYSQAQLTDSSLTGSSRNYARAELSAPARSDKKKIQYSDAPYLRAEKINYALPETPAYPAGDNYADEFESSARLIPTPAASSTAASHRSSAELVRMPERSEERTPAQQETPRYSSRNWRSEAWERERERELRAASRMRSNG